MHQLNITWPATSLIGLEWNALTYAGHTVWNVHNEQHADGGYKAGVKRRPRSEWLIERDTHPALVSDAIAEAVLQQVSSSVHVPSRDHGAGHLLTGLLRTPDETPWYGNRTARAMFYRVKTAGRSRNMPAHLVDRAVLEKVSEDLQSSGFVTQALFAMRRRFPAAHGEDIAKAAAEIKKVDARMSRLLDLAGELESPARCFVKWKS